jgi:hypothetical protein
MSDRTSYTLKIYECPREAAAEVVEVIVDGDYPFDNIDWCEAIPTDRVLLGDPYTAQENSVGATADIASALTELGVTFELFEDPKYDWDGDYTAHVPGLGTANLGCDGSGNVHVDVAAIDAAIEKVEAEITGHRGALAYERLVAELNQLTDRPIRKAIAEMREREATFVIIDPAEVDA